MTDVCESCGEEVEDELKWVSRKCVDCRKQNSATDDLNASLEKAYNEKYKKTETPYQDEIKRRERERKKLPKGEGNTGQVGLQGRGREDD